jgi:hypothetical protein
MSNTEQTKIQNTSSEILLSQSDQMIEDMMEEHIEQLLEIINTNNQNQDRIIKAIIELLYEKYMSQKELECNGATKINIRKAKDKLESFRSDDEKICKYLYENL